MRTRLSWIACIWLCCQLSLLAGTPLSLLTHAPAMADAATCTCVHTGNAQCPMHHPKPEKRGCECRSTTDPDAASIVSLLGPTAVLADAPALIEPPAITKSPNHQITRFTDSITPPDGPPPRA